ncbi:MAG: amidohydrolase family protein [Eubacteriales bacterium]|nr:amidohydrolase family protein [Eubacteriales bacterium]
MIDGHIHYIEYMGADRLNKVIEEYGYEAVALQCIPDVSGKPTEEDAFRFKAHCKVPVYVFGGLDRGVYSLPEKNLKGALVGEVDRLMNMGCTGVKMLEAKPNIRKQWRIPDFDLDVWEDYWNLLEQKQIPIYMHVNDPEDFWDESKVSEFAKKAGWFYDESYVNNEDQYRQVFAVLDRHPGLRVLFPHFFFFSEQMRRLGDVLDRYPNVYIDITPGSELYYNLSERREEALCFFEKYQDRICFGTDIGARVLVAEEKKKLCMEECDSRLRLIRTFLEAEGDYPLRPDGYYITGEDRTMHGLGLSEEILDKIYRKNFLNFIRKE